jgi:hypothetical protein
VPQGTAHDRRDQHFRAQLHRGPGGPGPLLRVPALDQDHYEVTAFAYRLIEGGPEQFPPLNRQLLVDGAPDAFATIDRCWQELTGGWQPGRDQG